MTIAANCADSNCILSALPREERDPLRLCFRAVSLRRGEIIAEDGEVVERVYFPNRCVVSIVSLLEDGTVVETATIGREGAFGFPAAFGTTWAAGQIVVQIPGTAAVISHARLRRVADAHGGLRTLFTLMAAWDQAFVAQLLQSVACNATHAVEQRLCRALLMAHDRYGEDTLPLTQEFLAEMLHVRRASVSAAAASLQDRRVIRYRRGWIHIADRPGLEQASCECYRTVRRVYERLLPGPYP